MEIINQIIDMEEIHHYIYVKEGHLFKNISDHAVSTVYHIQEMLKIIFILDEYNITYTIDGNQNIIL